MQTGPEDDFRIGVMTMDVERRDSEAFERLVDAATETFNQEINVALGLRAELLAFDGPHLVPADGGYAPLDFLRLGMTEKLDRRIHFLLIVTEVDLAATALTYTLALPSQLTNVAVVSTKRLDPGFRAAGRRAEDADDAKVPGGAAANLSTLLVHSFGHLLNLPHAEDPGNLMFGFRTVEDLAGMRTLTESQRGAMRRAVPREAHERVRRGGWADHAAFAVETLWRDRGSIAHAVARANPLRLARRLPTMVTASLSVLIVLFFSPEPWDIGSTVDLWQLVAFAVLAVLAAAAALYRAFSFGRLSGGGRVLAESSVVTAAAVGLSLVLTMLLLFTGFAALALVGASTVFPARLMETWPTVDPAVRTLDHVKVSLFLAAFATLAGSLGGRADRRDLVRGVLFSEENT